MEFTAPVKFGGHQINAGSIRDLVFHAASSASDRARPLHITCMDDIKRKIPDVQITGHPSMFFLPIYRMSSVEKGFSRSLDVCPIAGGGCLVQSSWNEDGRPSQDFFYDDRLILEAHVYQTDDGETAVGMVIARKRWWRSLFRTIKALFRKNK